MARSSRGMWGTVAVVAVVTCAGLAAADDKKAVPKAPPSDVYDVLFARYLESARQVSTATTASGANWMTNLALDPRARNVNDLVTIRIDESINASGSADSTLGKSSTAKAGVSQVFGAESKFPSWLDGANLVGAASDTNFKGSGSTNRSGVLTAVVTARVVEVLPSGDLVLEGAHEIEINGDRQIIVLTGVVRPSDISRSNVVASTKVGQMRIRYFGRGLIKDNLQPGWLVRIVNKIF